MPVRLHHVGPVIEVFPAARRTNAAAALAVTRKAPATSPTAEGVEAFLQDRGR